MLKELRLEYLDRQETREMKIQVLYSDRKTLGLEVSRDGQVRIRAPKRTQDRVIRELAESKKAWIVQNYLKVAARLAQASQREVPDYVKNPHLESKYRRMARERIQQRTAYFARLMGVTYGRITIREAKTRWGSCSSRGNLNFHWKLVLMPPEVLDYVVVHELAHRKQMNHSPAFWAEVAQVMPDYAKRREWLKRFGAEL